MCFDIILNHLFETLLHFRRSIVCAVQYSISSYFPYNHLVQMDDYDLTQLSQFRREISDGEMLLLVRLSLISKHNAPVLIANLVYKTFQCPRWKPVAE